MKKAAIDVGIKRTGFAFTDPEEKIISKVKTVETADIDREINENMPLSEIIVGFPINLQNRFTPSTYMAVNKAIEIAKNYAPVPVYLMDERFTTKIASEMRKKHIIDGISASILLEERLNGSKGRRVFWSLPFLSDKISSLFSLGNFKNVCMMGEDLRGIESKAHDLNFLIFEEDPTFFVLRSRCNNCTLHFGIDWDIILQSANNIDLVICSQRYVEKAKEIFREGTAIVSEGSEYDGLYIGGRWIRIETVKDRENL
ncbi:RuvX/YqgF family protein [Athalassotoga saccharophila]|uniref:RuvX/YqgF family protein n=1 Tax=Athalassotoga saccharophila TaxID=1441386 RepID=UPI001E53F656|nr:RuvX/YqgF family protein [Athalassotoga saccharophila]BBJ27834.1 putative pre-16S rRNA nuclease [Athalassotoga saccharophila]